MEPHPILTEADRFRGCLLGLAVGDAVGTSVEFEPRGSFPPVTDMDGGGCFHLRPGQWTDDTSMALCLAASLTERGGFDADDQMRRYLRWSDDGYMSSTGRCFDIGSTVTSALDRYKQTGDPFSGSTDENSAGNGCIMRLAPVPMFYFPERQAARHYAVESSKTTHGTQECLDACWLLADILYGALRGDDRQRLLFQRETGELVSEKILAIARGEYAAKPESAIRTKPYVVDTLEAALWCFLRTDSFEAAILKATNLGDDSDTTAAVCGQVAGAYYGESGIPARWLERLTMRQEITELADALWQAGGRKLPQSPTNSP